MKDKVEGKADWDLACGIVARCVSFTGAGRPPNKATGLTPTRENIAHMVAEGIAVGRLRGLVMARDIINIIVTELKKDAPHG
jgi:hypothetical protein